MVSFAAAAILFQTSNVMEEHHVDQYVVASVAPFSAVTILLGDVLRLVGFVTRD
jgi:hypothetical protein